MKTEGLDFEDRVCKFCDENFKRDMPSRLKKLMEEIGELAERIAAQDDVGTIEEAADVQIVLTDLVNIAGGSLACATTLKFQKLLVRKSNGTLHKEDRIRKEIGNG